MTMPQMASPLNTYVRYFSGEFMGGRRIVIGTFVYDPQNADVRIVAPKQMPKILDGGCDIINLTYDVDQKQILTLFCNGES